MLMAAASAVKAAPCFSCVLEGFRCSFSRSGADGPHRAHVSSLLFFAARSEAVVSPPPTLMRFNERRMPRVGIGARFELNVRELTPIHEISEDRRPYSIFGQRFMTTLRPAAYAFAPRASPPAPRFHPTPLRNGPTFKTSSK